MLTRTSHVVCSLRSGLSRRWRALWCVAALAGIAMLSSLTAWLLWDATVERRLVVGDPVADVRDDATLANPPPEPPAGIATTGSRLRAPQPAGDAPRAVAPPPSAIPGPALAAASSGAALLVGGIAATLVVRR